LIKRDIHITPRLLDRARMAVCLCISEDTLDKMRGVGCPSIHVPGTKNQVRFDPDAVIEWMKAQPSHEAVPIGASAIDILGDVLNK